MTTVTNKLSRNINGIYLELTNDAYNYNDQYYTLEIFNPENEECDADISGLDISATFEEVQAYLNGAEAYLTAQIEAQRIASENPDEFLEDAANINIRRLSHGAALAGLDAVHFLKV